MSCQPSCTDVRQGVVRLLGPALGQQVLAELETNGKVSCGCFAAAAADALGNNLPRAQ